MTTTQCDKCAIHLIITITGELVASDGDPNVLCLNCGHLNYAENEGEPPDFEDADDPHGITAHNAWEDEEYGLNDGCGR